MEIVILVKDQCKEIEVAISVNKSSSKIYELSLYNKVVNKSFPDYKQRDVIKKKLQNLANH